MHAETVAGFLAAWVILYGAITAWCAVALASPLADQAGARAPEVVPSTDGRPRGERPHRLPYLLFGLLTLALSVYSAGRAAFYLEAVHWTRALTLANAGRVAALTLLVHLVLDYTFAGQRWSRLALIALYNLMGSLEVANIAGLFYPADVAREEPVRFLGLVLREVSVPPTLTSVAFAAASVAAVVVAVTVLARAFARGKHHGIASFLGLSALSATVTHDAARALGWGGGPEVAPYGFAAFVLGIIATRLARYTTIHDALQQRTHELRQRSKELLRSFDELRATQSELVRKEQLAAVGELAAVIAHEVRNPLAIIANAVATLRRAGLPADDRDTLLGILDEETSRLNRLVGDLLSYARPVRVERQLLSLREIVERALVIANGRAELEVELLQPKPVEKVWGDPGLLRQVIENLLTNAIQAMEGIGTLTITLVAAQQNGDAGVEVSIQDTGEGMDTLVRRRALDPFFTTRPAGTGLGLAIVARVVDAHGGNLRIASRAGSGTIVHVFIPVASEAASIRLSRPEIDRPSTLPPMPAELERAMGARRG